MKRPLMGGALRILLGLCCRASKEPPVLDTAAEPALSTLVVHLREPLPALAGEGGGVLRTLARSFKEAGENFVSTVAGIIALSGAALPIAFVLWLLFYLWKRRRRRAATG
jgi:hypothetical protein